MPRTTKDEHAASLAVAKADGASDVLLLIETLHDQRLDAAIILGAVHGLVKQLRGEAVTLVEQAAARPEKPA